MKPVNVAVLGVAALTLAACSTPRPAYIPPGSHKYQGRADTRVCMVGKESSFDDFATLLHDAGFDDIESCSPREAGIVARITYADCGCSKHYFRVRIVLDQVVGHKHRIIDLSSTGTENAGETDAETAHRLIEQDAGRYAAKLAMCQKG